MGESQSKVSTSIAIAPDLRDRLDAEAAKQERSRSFISAVAIREYLEKRNAALEMGMSGHADAHTRAYKHFESLQSPVAPNLRDGRARGADASSASPVIFGEEK